MTNAGGGIKETKAYKGAWLIEVEVGLPVTEPYRDDWWGGTVRFCPIERAMNNPESFAYEKSKGHAYGLQMGRGKAIKTIDDRYPDGPPHDWQ